MRGIISSNNTVKKSLLILIIMLFVFSLSAQRNTKWARPVESVTITNFFQVDDGVYRCGQPDAQGFVELEEMGIKEVLNLRNFHSDFNLAKDTKLVLHRVRMSASNSNYNELVRALRIIKNREGPIVIHCWHGSDRTGIVIALYRLVFQDWTKEEAVDELINGGYGYHSIYKNIIIFIQDVDIIMLKEAVFLQ